MGKKQRSSNAAFPAKHQLSKKRVAAKAGPQTFKFRPKKMTGDLENAKRLLRPISLQDARKSDVRIFIETTDSEGHPVSRPYAVRVINRLSLNDVRDAVRRVEAGGLAELKAYTQEEIYSLVVPKRTLARREAQNEPLTIEETDKAFRLARIAAQAEKVFGDREKAGRWLRKPKRSLAGETPIVYLASEAGARVVEEMLGRIDHGIVP